MPWTSPPRSLTRGVVRTASTASVTTATDLARTRTGSSAPGATATGTRPTLQTVDLWNCNGEPMNGFTELPMSDEQAEILGYIGLGLFAMTFPVWLPVLCGCLIEVAS